MSTTLPFTPYAMGNIILSNRFAMAPMTRCRAIGNIPNDLMAEYYTQRATSGLIITEGTSPSANGLGYARIPGIYTKEQIEGWKKVTSAVHQKDGKIFMQMMHCGRVSHPLNMPPESHILSPSTVQPHGTIWTDQQGLQPYPVPHAMTADEIQVTKQEFVQGALNAIEAGFDGIELHSANGYLLEQFISPNTNQRQDEYGGSIENRCRFVLEIAEAVSEAIGNDKTGIRLSPYGTANDMKEYPEIEATYHYLAEQLQKLDLVYLHLVDHSSMGAPSIPIGTKKAIRQRFKNTLILAGGYDLEAAENDLKSGLANLIGFGRPFIYNPDLSVRFQNNWPVLQSNDTSAFYTSDKNGYTDYPVYKEAAMPA